MVEEETANSFLKNAALAGTFLAVAVALLTYSYYPTKTFSESLGYFSDDDGQSWYVDNLDTLPPYKHGGKEAVRAVIYSYAHGSKQFCGYLMRFPEAAKAKITGMANAKAERPTTIRGIAYETEMSSMAEVKCPLSNEPWAGINSSTGNAVMRVHSPDGSELDSVMP